jgi:hypothetical protein
LSGDPVLSEGLPGKTMSNRRLTMVFANGASAIAASVLLFIGLLPTPAPLFQFAHRGSMALDLHFSPDGRQLAVVLESIVTGENLKQWTRIYDVPDGNVLQEIANGNRRCAWSPNGCMLAVLHGIGVDFDLWDTRTWTKKQRLHLTVLDDMIRSGTIRPDDQNMVWVQRLCFDQHANLYVVENSVAGELELPPHLVRPHAWCNEGGHLVGGESIGTVPEISTQFDISAAPVGSETRVAIAYCSGPPRNCRVDILKVRMDAGGKRSVEREYQLPEGGTVCLTPNGEYLAMLNRSFSLFRFSNNHADLVYSREAKPAAHTGSELDVSLDGRLAAYASEGQVHVVRIPDCRSVLAIRQRAYAIALSPDGRLLAVADPDRESIRFYRIPQ